MMWPQFQAIAQIAIGRVLNSLPEGLLVALFAGATVRIFPRQNSRTRFAVWFIALLAVAALPIAGLPGTSVGASAHFLPVAGAVRPLITVSFLWGIILFLAWTLTASLALLRLTTGLWRLRALRRSCIPIEPAQLDPATRKTVADFSSSRLVSLATSEQLSVPAAIGFFRPMIVIPRWALQELPPEELNVILLHEFAHLHRWDDWTNLLQKVVRAVLPFHPAIWWIDNRLSLEREMACDDRVLAETADAGTYAKCLIALLEKSVARRGWSMAQAAVHRAREASLRLARILDGNRANTRQLWKPAVCLVAAFSFACLAIAPRSQFVAFAPDPPAARATGAASVAFNQFHSSSAAVVPAALHVSASSVLARAPRPAGRMAGRADEHPAVKHPAEPVPPIPLVLATGLSTAGSARIELVTEGPGDAPAETLLMVRTAQCFGPDMCGWSITVWRVILKDPAQDQMNKVPVAKKT